MAEGPDRMRKIWLAVGWGFVGLAFAGVWLPLLPTVPFLLVAAWAFAKSSPAARAWLFEHRVFGPLLRDWFEHGRVSPTSKALSVVGMGLGFAVMVTTTNLPLAVYVVVFGILLAVGVFVTSRPSQPSLPTT